MYRVQQSAYLLPFSCSYGLLELHVHATRTLTSIEGRHLPERGEQTAIKVPETVAAASEWHNGKQQGG